MRIHALVVVVAFLAMASWGAEEKVAAATDPADATKPNEWHGTVGCAKCDYVEKTGLEECAPALKTADGVFLMKPGPTAPPAIKEFLARIQEKTMQGDYLVKGESSEVDGKKWIAVTSMVAKPLPKPTATLTMKTNRDRSSAAGGGPAAAGGAAAGGDGGGRRGGWGGADGGGRKHRHGGDDAGGGGGGEEGQ